MHLTLVAATQLEIKPFLDKYHYDPQHGRYQKEYDIIDILITGVGSASTIYVLSKYLQDNTPDLIIQAGIGGAINDLEIASVYSIGVEEWLDYGIEQYDGTHESLFDSGLQNPDSHPYTGGKLINENSQLPGLTQKNGGTVHQVLGSEIRINHILKNSEAEIISMEGAAFFYVMLQEFSGNFHQIRSISNRVTPRDKSTWQIEQAVINLCDYLESMHDGFFSE